MSYTVKQVAAMSGASVRTLHFYDETDLLKPAYFGANGYRYYEEPQLLTLQQILFYRELGFELKHIQRILTSADFEKVAALESHRKTLQKNLARTRALIGTIDKTVQHLKGKKTMKSKDLFAGFSVTAGGDRFGKRIKLGTGPDTECKTIVDCKVSSKDTAGAMCVFEFSGGGGPRHLHYDQDEWIYIMEGEFEFLIGEKRSRLGAGESVFIPRNVAHAWERVGGEAARIINVYQPAGKMEAFFRTVGKMKGIPTREQVLKKNFTARQKTHLHQVFESHGMDLLGPPLETCR